MTPTAGKVGTGWGIHHAMHATGQCCAGAQSKKIHQRLLNKGCLTPAIVKVLRHTIPWYWGSKRRLRRQSSETEMLLTTQCLTILSLIVWTFHQIVDDNAGQVLIKEMFKWSSERHSPNTCMSAWVELRTVTGCVLLASTGCSRIIYTAPIPFIFQLSSKAGCNLIHNGDPFFLPNNAHNIVDDSECYSSAKYRSWPFDRTRFVVSCPASFHSHAEEKSLVKCLFSFCSVRQDLGAPIRLQNVSYVITFAKGIIHAFQSAPRMKATRWARDENQAVSWQIAHRLCMMAKAKAVSFIYLPTRKH